MNTKEQIKLIRLATGSHVYRDIKDLNIIAQMKLSKHPPFFWAFRWHWNTASFKETMRYCCPRLNLSQEAQRYLAVTLSSLSASEINNQLL